MFEKLKSLFGTRKRELSKPPVKQETTTPPVKTQRANYQQMKREVDNTKRFLNELADYKKRAEAAETENRLEEAAEIYYDATELAIVAGIQVTQVSNFYERMAIIYRKLKDYTLERSTLENYIRLCESEGSYCAKKFYDRLEKAKALEKNKIIIYK